MSRRLPIGPEGRRLRTDPAYEAGSTRGRIGNAFPVGDAGGRGRARATAATAAAGAGGGVQFFDQFDTAPLTVAGSQSLALTYLPLPYSEHVFLNGVRQTRGVGADYSITGQTLNVTAAMDARVGDVLAVEYAYSGGVPTAAADGVSPDAQMFLPLDETSGTVANDASGQGHHGAYAGTPTLAQSPLRAGGGTSVLFSGDDYVDVPYGAWMDLTTFSIDAFIKTTSTAAVMSIVTRIHSDVTNGFVWALNVEAGSLKFHYMLDAGAQGESSYLANRLTLTSTAAVNNGAARHVAIVVSTTTVKMYVDGSLNTSATLASPIAVGLARITAGAQRLASGAVPIYFFTGNLDEIGFYGLALTAAQVAAQAAR